MKVGGNPSPVPSHSRIAPDRPSAASPGEAFRRVSESNRAAAAVQVADATRLAAAARLLLQEPAGGAVTPRPAEGKRLVDLLA